MHWRILGEGFCFGEELELLGILEGTGYVLVC